MTTPNDNAAVAPETEQNVCDYLQEHPDFFVRHADLLLTLKIPHACGGAVSLVERQMSALRADNKKLSTQLLDLIGIAKENDQVNQQIDQLTLSLFEAKSVTDVFAIIQNSLNDDFQADVITLKLFSNDPAMLDLPYFQSYEKKGSEHFEYFMNSGKPRCGRFSVEQRAYLFAERGEAVQSCAMIPLTTQTAQGFLAIGSKDEARYHPGRGTTFLEHLAQLLSKVIQVHTLRASA